MIRTTLPSGSLYAEVQTDQSGFPGGMKYVHTHRTDDRYQKMGNSREQKYLFFTKQIGTSNQEDRWGAYYKEPHPILVQVMNYLRVLSVGPAHCVREHQGEHEEIKCNLR